MIRISAPTMFEKKTGLSRRHRGTEEKKHEIDGHFSGRMGSDRAKVFLFKTITLFHPLF